MQKIDLKNKTTRFALVTFAILVFLEIFVFNFNAFRLAGSDYEKTELDLAGAETLNFERTEAGELTFKNENKIPEKEREFFADFVSGDEFDSLFEDTKQANQKKNSMISVNTSSTEEEALPTSASLEITNINRPVKTITFHIKEMNLASKTSVSVKFTDATTAVYSPQREDSVCIDLIQNNTKSHTSVLQLSGEVGSLYLTFNMPNTQSSIVLSGITVNEPVAFHFSFVRLVLLFGLIMGLYLLLHAKPLKKPFAENSVLNTQIAVMMTAVFLLAAITISSDHLSLDKFKSTNGNQVTEELVEAFKAGQVHLLAEPSEELLSLNNPYDRSEREASGAEYLWDHCLYNGKYYSYYGIAPVLLLFLPYNLVTGYYFPSNIAVLLFSLAGIVCLSLVYLEIAKRRLQKSPGAFVLMGLLILQLSCGIWFSVARPQFYEIAISSGFACVLAGAYFLISSNVISPGRLSLPRLTLSSIFLSLAVLCRPTLAVYCVAALFFIWFGLEKAKTDDGRLDKKAAAKYLLAALAPFAVIGSVQVVYNYLRFGSPFEFGIQYSLTINDFVRSEFDIHFVFVLLFAYLFNSPGLVPNFPFVSSGFHTLNTNGYMFVDYQYVNAISTGLFFRALPMFSYFLAPTAYRMAKKPKKAALLLGVTCVAAPLVIIASAWESGYSPRYNADISWPMILGALLILFTVYENIKSKETKRMALYCMTFCTALCLLVNFAQIYYFILDTASTQTRASLLSFARLFDFWR
ncbi:MAG: hypothetical protein LBS36_06835 [Oscillospiraceae bacterium]|jgi:hypothetical protein|nr:hypothetical protein [Oscillospiraceae bacterium]